MLAGWGIKGDMKYCRFCLAGYTDGYAFFDGMAGKGVSIFAVMAVGIQRSFTLLAGYGLPLCISVFAWLAGIGGILVQNRTRDACLHLILRYVS